MSSVPVNDDHAEEADTTSTPAPCNARSASAPARSILRKREDEIAKLVAEGLSNRAIAESLVLSPRPIDGHVERILIK
ncbi:MULTISPECIES: LuxR C-terminal-related transcriptional regulator [unclassified Rhodococcus (in: high G+C Gram-positive bacteria)]|uniref:response regulator transcription factor n=1 Tax=unclassified Rhodococcus (in: high G+C Gram-positive bacteria) TaxID=192944 RepID=UPI00289654DA|nr:MULTISPECIES: LuxR C-terminal-related transcriptional regulator [unclassified Rhodococcus (in: high G+C Gram-positive bacteria)]